MNVDVIPVVRELSADTLTPVVAYAALSGEAKEAIVSGNARRLLKL